MRLLAVAATVLALATAGCGSARPNRAELAAPEKRAEVVEDIDVSSDPSFYRGEARLKSVGVMSVLVAGMVQTREVKETQKYISKLKVGLDMDNLRWIADQLEGQAAVKLGTMGFDAVKAMPAMMAVPGYDDKGSRIEGVKARKNGFDHCFYDVVANGGNAFEGVTLSSMMTDEEWGDKLHTGAGVDALLFANLHSTWYLKGKETVDGVKGVRYDVVWKPFIYVVVPWSAWKARREAAGKSVPWVAGNDMMNVQSETEWMVSVFFPTNDTSDAAVKLSEQAWTGLRDEMGFSLDLYLERFKTALATGE